MNQNSYFVFSTSGSDNTGDDAILLGAVKIIREKLPRQHLFIVTSDKSKTPRIKNSTFIKHNLISGPRLEALKSIDFYGIVKHMIKSKMVIFAGGTIIHDNHPLNLIYFSLMTLLARLLGKKVVFWGVGVNKVETNLGKMLTKITFFLSSGIYLRDEISIKKVGWLAPKKCIAASDLAFYLDYPVRKRFSKEIRSFLEKKSFKKKIGFSVYGKYKQEYHLKRNLVLNKEAKKLAQVAEQLIAKYQAGLVMIPNEKPADKDFLDKIYNNIVNKNKVLFIKKRPGPVALVNLLRYLDLSFNMRLHSVIFSIIAGTPFLNLQYAPKVTNLIMSFDLSEMSISFSDFSVETVLDRVDYIFDNYLSLKEKLKSVYRRQAAVDLASTLSPQIWK